MVLEPTNWRANAERPACQETGRGPGGLRAGALGVLLSLPRLCHGEQAPLSSKPWFPCLPGACPLGRARTDPVR